MSRTKIDMVIDVNGYKVDVYIDSNPPSKKERITMVAQGDRRIRALASNAKTCSKRIYAAIRKRGSF